MRRRVFLAGLGALAFPARAKERFMELTPDWEYVADTVMGGVSRGSAQVAAIAGRQAAHLTGRVSTENNGGFIQLAFDLSPSGGVFDASAWQGIALDVIGNREIYDLRLRTDQLSRPWQSFRAEFTAPESWETIRFPFSGFAAHRTDATFDPARLRRLGVLAIGREFDADVAVGGVRFY